MKKINLKIYITILIFILMILFSKNISESAESWHGDGDFANKDETKSLYNIYLTMREKPIKWLNSKPKSYEKIEVDWEGEYPYTSKYKDGIIYHMGALCFGHATRNSGDNVKIYTFDIDYNSSRSELKLAYLIGKSIENEEVHNSNEYKNMIRKWLWENSSKYGIKVQSKNDAYKSYDEDEVNEYADKLANRKFGLKNTTTTTVTEVGKWTYIGPIRVRADKDNPINLKLKVGENKYDDIFYYSESENGERIEIGDEGIYTEKNDGTVPYKIIWLAKKTENITGDIIGVKAIQTVSFYKAKVVLSQPTSNGGQNICIFYGKSYDEDLEKEISVTPPEEEEYIIEIIKENDLGERLPGVQFIIEFAGTDEFIKSETDLKSFGTRAEAKIFTTDSRGMISFKGLTGGVYDIYEIYNPYKEYTVDPYKVVGRVFTNTNEDEDYTATITIENKIEKIEISGAVWEDGIEGKESIINNCYDVGSEDKELQYVRVKLMSGSNIIKETTTNVNGYYTFSEVPVDQLSNYYIEFEYNGMSYQSLDNVDYTQNKTSKAKEENREWFNNKYQKIIKDYAQGNSGNISLSYEYNNHKSKLKYGDKPLYGYSEAENPISGVYENFVITAKTPTLEYLKEENEETKNNYLKTKSIDNINLGLYVREQPDIALIEDIEKIEMKVNGYEHTYKYDQRPVDINFMNGGITTTEGKNYFKNKYSSKSYNRDIYKSDIVYSNNEETEDEDKLKIYVTYKLTLRNEAESLDAKINEIYSYYDNRYDLVSVTDKDGKALKYYTAKNKYGALSIYDINVNHGSVYNIYIKYRLTDEAIKSILTGDIIINTVTEVASYSSTKNGAVYGGVDKDSAPDNYFGKINKAQELDNNFISIRNSYEDLPYEDDTDEAPPINLTASKNRVIQGSVWEDEAREDLLNSSEIKQRVGNGEYDDNENVVGNVKVELLDKDGKVALLYPFINQSYEPSEASTETISEDAGKGTYRFEGVIPDEYYLRYTYGNESVIFDKDGNKISNIEVENYKSTIYKGGNTENSSNYWYKYSNPRLSDAKDIYGFYEDGTSCNIVEKRTTSSEIKYDTVMYESTLNSIQAETEKINIMLDANTEDNNSESEFMENNKFVFNNVDFGIIERPKQDLELKKEVSYVEITLANGQTIISGDPRKEDDINYLKMLPDGKAYIEIDNEIMQGATLKVEYEITVNNNCEVDYNDVNYYYYGEVQDASSLAIATITQLYDYPSNSLEFNNENQTNENTWIEVEIDNNLVQEGFISEDTYNKIINTYEKVLMTEEFKDIQPGESKSVTMKLSRLLSNSEEDFDFVNDIEVITLKNRKMENCTPGSYVPGDSSTHENDDDSATVIVTTPTGENMNYAYYVGIGILTLIILGTGIILIKKKVLKKEDK